MYKLLKQREGETGTVLRLADAAAIPFEPENRDYKEYLKWLAAGNTPEPVDEQN
jgi:hypothetical protein